MKYLLAFLMLIVPVSAGVVDDLQDASVTIKADRAQGSGVLFTRDNVTYVWTAGHVVDGLRKTRIVIDSKTGTPKTLVEFEDAQIVQEFRQDGRRIGEINFDATVIRYSDAEDGEDLALLRVRKTGFTKATVVFYKGEIPALGTELYHVGSLLGQFGANSFTTGVVSQTGRVLHLGANGTVFDQTTVTAFPGSSGGGVFLKDGQYIGMLVRGAGEQFNLIVPIRRMRSWAERAGVAWALDASIPMPSDEDLRKMPIEDAGVPDSIISPIRSVKEFPYLLETH